MHIYHVYLTAKSTQVHPGLCYQSLSFFPHSHFYTSLKRSIDPIILVVYVSKIYALELQYLQHTSVPGSKTTTTRHLSINLRDWGICVGPYLSSFQSTQIVLPTVCLRNNFRIAHKLKFRAVCTSKTFQYRRRICNEHSSSNEELSAICYLGMFEVLLEIGKMRLYLKGIMLRDILDLCLCRQADDKLKTS
jgi:hypothetical protein